MKKARRYVEFSTFSTEFSTLSSVKPLRKAQTLYRTALFTLQMNIYSLLKFCSVYFNKELFSKLLTKTDFLTNILY